jgi:hypothetical protein
MLHTADVLTAHCARFAHFRAHCTELLVVRGAAQHEIGRGRTDLRAIEHQAEMVRLRVATAALEAHVCSGLQAFGMAVLAILDTLLHVGSERWAVRHDGDLRFDTGKLDLDQGSSSKECTRGGHHSPSPT